MEVSPISGTRSSPQAFDRPDTSSGRVTRSASKPAEGTASGRVPAPSTTTPRPSAPADAAAHQQKGAGAPGGPRAVARQKAGSSASPSNPPAVTKKATRKASTAAKNTKAAPTKPGGTPPMPSKTSSPAPQGPGPFPHTFDFNGRDLVDHWVPMVCYSHPLRSPRPTHVYYRRSPARNARRRVSSAGSTSSTVPSATTARTLKGIAPSSPHTATGRHGRKSNGSTFCMTSKPAQMPPHLTRLHQSGIPSQGTRRLRCLRGLSRGSTPSNPHFGRPGVQRACTSRDPHSQGAPHSSHPPRTMRTPFPERARPLCRRRAGPTQDQAGIQHDGRHPALVVG